MRYGGRADRQIERLCVCVTNSSVRCCLESIAKSVTVGLNTYKNHSTFSSKVLICDQGRIIWTLNYYSRNKVLHWFALIYIYLALIHACVTDPICYLFSKWHT